MRLIDMHCDTIFELFRRGNMNFKNNTLGVDLKKLKDAESMAQFFACFIYMKMFQGEERFSKGYRYALDMISFAKKEFEKYPNEIMLVKSYEELLQNEKVGKISAFLTAPFSCFQAILKGFVRISSMICRISFMRK